MIIKKISVTNFKSIGEVELDFRKIGGSYTKMLVGINESGKSNLLQALSLMKPMSDTFDYDALCHQKEEGETISIGYYLEFENPSSYLDPIQSTLGNGDLLNFRIKNISKCVFMNEGDTDFSLCYDFDIHGLTKNLSIKTDKETKTIDGKPIEEVSYTLSKAPESEDYEELTVDLLREIIETKVESLIDRYEPKVIIRKPSHEYLISEANLQDFAEDINSNIPLRNLFFLAGFDNSNKIKNIIGKISSGTSRSKLVSKLNTINKYIKKIRKHNIEAVIDITETGAFSLSMKDSGKRNEHDRFKISERSEGAKHFLSLILSISIDTEVERIRNNLILIDEPEIHLHPSGIRDLKNELINIGKKNFLVCTTHSPFLIDKDSKKRNIIIQKDNSGYSHANEIGDEQNMVDDEVLRVAFGIEVYRDLMNPHSLLVEGYSDKLILAKTLKSLGSSQISITNGHGSNIVSIAAKLNFKESGMITILDDDNDGASYKRQIVDLGGLYSQKNVFTIRDIETGIVNGGTIEDTLGEKFLVSKFESKFKDEFGKKLTGFVFDYQSPFLLQASIYVLKSEKLDKTLGKEFIDDLKIYISNEFEAPKTLPTLKKNFPLLLSLCQRILKTISS